MSQFVPHTRYVLPRNVRVLDPDFSRQSLGGFADDLELPNDAILNQGYLAERLFIDASQLLFDPGNGIEDVVEVD